MRRIVRLNMVSVLSLFAVFYAVVGLWASSKAVMTHQDAIVCPFGFAFPMAQAVITVTIHLPNPAT